MDVNQTQKSIERIEAKIALGIPTTEREKALYALYGKNEPRTEAEIKTAFVAQYLSPLLANADVGVTGATYTVADGDEWVILTYARTEQKKRVCVSADSLITLVTDVIDGVHGGGQWI